MANIHKRVAEDVREGWVPIEQARKVYGYTGD